MKFIFYYKEQTSVLDWHEDKLSENNFTSKHIPLLYEECKKSFAKYYDIKVLDNLDVPFTYQDDYKVKLIEIYPDDIITDPDIILHKKLSIPPGYDVYLDRNHFKDTVKPFYSNLLKRYKNIPIKNFLQTNHHPNVGFLYFKNLELKKRFTDLYYELKDWTNNNLEFDPSNSTMIAQQNLGYLINEFNFKPCYLNQIPGNNYSHHIGDVKYKLDFKFNIKINI